MNALALIAAWIVVGAGLTQVPGLWAGRGAERLVKTMRPVWPLGDHLLLGYLKALPTLIVSALLLMLTVTVPRGTADAALAVATGAGVLLVAVIMVAGRPLALIPPRLRSVDELRDLS